MPADPLPEKTMLQALEELPESSSKQAARWYLNLDWRTLKTRDDFDQAFYGHVKAEELCGPLNERYLRALQSSRISLIAFDKQRQEWRKVAAKLAKVWDDVIEIAQRNMTPEAFEAARPKLELTARELRGEE